jgi:putative Holliday junction resolvase
MDRKPKRILGIDPGERRVGFAVSDELGLTAQGLDTFDRSRGRLMEHIRALVERYDIEEIVVGLPLSLSGDKGPSARRAESLAAKISNALGVRVTLWDERFSSAQAERVLRGSRAGKGAVDRISAVLILQNYLDFKGGG